MTHRKHRVPLGAAGLLSVMLIASPAFAEASSTQRATAEALFEQANQLMGEERFGEACEKFAASQELDPALGTMLYLADCYERAGRSASAWALFREAADRAQGAGQQDRAQIAKDRAESLGAKLSKLELRVPPGLRASGLQLLVNDVVVPRASWNAALPFDPGPTRIEARAPGKIPWKKQIELTIGPAEQALEIPKLKDAPAAPARTTRADPAREAAPGSAQRTAGYLLSGTGIVALAVGGLLGYRAYALNKRSKGECRADDPNACTPEGVHSRDDARTAAALSTVAAVGGGVLTVSGVALLLSAPSSSADGHGSASATRAPLVNVGLQWHGVW